MLSEFGGIACVPPGATAAAAGATWGYSRRDDAGSLGAAYGALLSTVRSLDLLAGFCYTQFADTYQEANGLLYADRSPKIPLEQIALGTRGPRQKR